MTPASVTCNEISRIHSYSSSFFRAVSTLDHRKIRPFLRDESKSLFVHAGTRSSVYCSNLPVPRNSSTGILSVSHFFNHFEPPAISCNTQSKKWTRIGHIRDRFTSQASKGSLPEGSNVEAVTSAGVIKKGSLIEVARDSNRTALVVVQKPDGKKNWMACDQNGNSFSVKPQQVTFVVPDVSDYKVESISSFLSQVESIKDDSLLELVWSELIAEEGSGITSSELSELLFSSNGPIESYAAHTMLANDRVYFKKRKGLGAIFEPRAESQVEELRVRVAAEEAHKAELQQFVDIIRKRLTLKPKMGQQLSTEWANDPAVSTRLQAIKDMALDTQAGNIQLAEESLGVLGLAKMAQSATDLLFRIGLFHKHINLDLLRSTLSDSFPDSVMASVSALLAEEGHDPDQAWRKDFSHMKVYTIDSEDTDEIDDGLSVEAMADGRNKIWVHIADPTRWISYGSTLDRHAKLRATSVYLCSGKLPMFPLQLAAGPMSLRQGERCCAVSVGIILHDDGSLAEWEIVNSTIVPTFRLTFEHAEELLTHAEEEEKELTILYQMAKQRNEWRLQQGAIEIILPEPCLKVSNPLTDDPLIEVQVIDQSTPSRCLVSEAMILCGEAVGRFGKSQGLVLPYRGQPEPTLPDPWRLEALPAGPCRSAVLVKCMTRSETCCSNPIPHAALGLQEYVQFTSPIRRYGDMLAHYQIKAVLRGDRAPLEVDTMEAIMNHVGTRSREARKQELMALRYWVLEYLRRKSPYASTPALMLRWVKAETSLVAIILLEIGYETVMRVSNSIEIGDIVDVVLTEVNPRAGTLEVKEASLFDIRSSSPSALAAAKSRDDADVMTEVEVY